MPVEGGILTMTSRSLLILSSLPLLCLAGCAGLPATSEADGSRYGHVTVITGDLPVLERGMSVEAVRQKLGEPAEIKPMQAEENAEVWIYYLEKFVGQTQVISDVNRPSFSGASATNPSGMISEPFYTMANQKLVVTLRLLIYNGRLVAHTAKSEQRIEF